MSTELPEVFRLDGRVAVVTGGGSGIGRAMCETFAAAGAAVVVGDINDGWGGETADRINAAGGRAVFSHADVGRQADHESLARQAEESFGSLSISCNLGGPPTPFVEIASITDEQFDTVLSTHLKSVMYGCQAAIPRMIRAGGGAILNMSSTAADMPAPTNYLYTVVKTGVIALTRVLAMEQGKNQIRVNAIAPGVTLTNFSRRNFIDEFGEVDEERREEWLRKGARMSPLMLTGTPEDQAWLALYLVSDASRFVTGQVIRANGGWSMA